MHIKSFNILFIFLFSFGAVFAGGIEEDPGPEEIISTEEIVETITETATETITETATETATETITEIIDETSITTTEETEEYQEIVATGLDAAAIVCDELPAIVKWSGGCVAWSGGYNNNGEEADYFVRYGN